VTVRVSLDRRAVRTVPMGFAIGRGRVVARQVRDGARGMVRVKSGAVKGSIGMEERHTATVARFIIRADHERAMLEHQGARPHVIRPRRRGGLLHFYWERMGATVTLVKVNHPGTKGSKFLTTPLIKYGMRAGYRVTITVGGLSGTI